MRKSTIKKPAKKTSSKTLPVHHLKPIDELLDAIPAKLEKLVTTVKSKLVKTIEQHKKAGLTLKTVQAKHKTKPSKLTQSAIKKSEQALAGIAAMLASLKEELATLQTQLATCKEMKKFLNTSGKASIKKNVAKKRTVKDAKKVVLDPPDVIAAEHF